MTLNLTRPRTVRELLTRATIDRLAFLRRRAMGGGAAPVVNLVPTDPNDWQFTPSGDQYTEIAPSIWEYDASSTWTMQDIVESVVPASQLSTWEASMVYKDPSDVTILGLWFIRQEGGQGNQSLKVTLDEAVIENDGDWSNVQVSDAAIGGGWRRFTVRATIDNSGGSLANMAILLPFNVVGFTQRGITVDYLRSYLAQVS